MSQIRNVPTYAYTTTIKVSKPASHKIKMCFEKNEQSSLPGN